MAAKSTRSASSGSMSLRERGRTGIIKPSDKQRKLVVEEMGYDKVTFKEDIASEVGELESFKKEMRNLRDQVKKELQRIREDRKACIEYLEKMRIKKREHAES